MSRLSTFLSEIERLSVTSLVYGHAGDDGLAALGQLLGSVVGLTNENDSLGEEFFIDFAYPPSLARA